MKMRPAVLRASASAPLAATALMLASCAHHVTDAPPLPAAPVPDLPASRLAQMGYGDRADFVHCLAPLCPVRTPKTLGAAPASTPAQATAEEAAPEPAIAPAADEEPPVAELASGDTVSPAADRTQTWNVGFAFGSARLGSIGLNTLARIASELPTDGRITIAGRTDDAGPAAVNEALARARAETVRDFLVRARPELETTISVEAAGKCCFAATNDRAAGRALNRRVEITLHAPAPPP